ncbi:MAG TPA: hypothetical protein VIU62_08735 [Chloroflexota bacterium]
MRVLETSLHILHMRARLPFRYGIATLTALPHLFVRVDLEVNGARQTGVASDGLAPKWFTKDPTTSFAADVADMLTVIEHAAALAQGQGPAASVFALWQQIDASQRRWAAEQGFPSLLVSFGISLIERAILDAFCRATRTPFAAAVRANTLGLRLGALHPGLGNGTPKEFLPAQPLSTIDVRHTIGLSDPLTIAEIPPEERLDDGLPQSLEESIRFYGLTYFKVKVLAQPEEDVARLRAILRVLAACQGDFRLTLDGNEQFGSVGSFAEFWQRLQADPTLAPLVQRVLFVEQPWPRHLALEAAFGAELRAWTDRPVLIIDESDAETGSLPQALALGYVGTSHKNCKGVIKGIANACLLEALRRQDGSNTYVLSGEDLANVGPIAVQQDLAVMATLGIGHVERNGHHYFRGLSMYPAAVQQQALAAHPDLYRLNNQQFATLAIAGGQLPLASINAAPFGVGFAFDVARYLPVSAWRNVAKEQEADE